MFYYGIRIVVLKCPNKITEGENNAFVENFNVVQVINRTFINIVFERFKTYNVKNHHIREGQSYTKLY